MILLQTTNSGMSSLIMFAMIFAVMYFFMIRPQIKKQKQEREYRLALKKGDKLNILLRKDTDLKNHFFSFSGLLFFFLSSSRAAPIISPILAPEDEDPYSFKACFSS